MKKSLGQIIMTTVLSSLLLGTPGALATTTVNLTPRVNAGTQVLKNNTVIVASVTTPEPGWLAIYASENKQPTVMLGVVKTKKGTQSALRVKLTNTKAITRQVFAVLQKDLGKKGVYEFPGADVHFVKDGQAVIASFNLTNITNQPKSLTIKTLSPLLPTPTSTILMIKVDASATSTKQPDATSPTSPAPLIKTYDTAPLGSTPPPPAPLKEFLLTAKQWRFEPAVLTVNKNDKVRLKITSKDIEHGFQIWEYDIKKIIPAKQTITIEFIADQVGTFDFTCSAQCGAGHDDMGGQLIVEE